MRLDPQLCHRLPTSTGAAPRCLIGVDGGGTGTRAVLADLDGRPLGQGEAGPSALGQGAAQAWRHIHEAVSAAARQAGWADLPLADCAIGLGLSGTGVATQLRDFLAAAPAVAAGALTTDGLAAVIGAHGGAPGAILIAGTGSVGEVLAANGERRLVGGWGWQIGDEGSGAWLGRRAMQHAQGALDGREPERELARAVWAQCGSTREALLAWCASAGQAAYASLAPLVFEHAEPDGAASRLLAQAVRELERLAFALDPDQRLPLALGGSIAKRLSPEFAAPLRARLVEPQGDATAGALLLIRHHLDHLAQN